MKIINAQNKKYFDPEYWIQNAKIINKKRHFSNFGEQEIIEKYIDLFKIDRRSKTVVDIGAGDGIRKSNTYNLFLNGWRGVGIEGGKENAARLANAYKYTANAFACRCFVTPLNVLHLLAAYSVEKDFGVLSLDIDGYDYWVLDAVLANYRPRLIVSEYNEKIPPPIKFAVNFVPDFELRHHFFGYSLAKMEELLAKHNYVLLEIEYNNVFLAPAELEGAAPVDIGKAYEEGYVGRADRKEKFRANENMEALLTMEPAEGVEFLRRFYAEHEGQYEIGL